MFFAKAKEVCLDILFPAICLSCQKTLSLKSEGSLCLSCFGSITINSSFFCPLCRLRLANNEKVCSHQQGPWNYLLAAVSDYNIPAVSNLIRFIKFKSFKNLSQVLSQIISDYLENLDYDFKDFVVVAIPLHPSRQRSRGFNQAELVAQIIAEKNHLEIADILMRVKNTEPQSKSKDKMKRIENVTDCFGLKKGSLVGGKNIVLVDDVFTSGATINEAVKILRQNGAHKIIAFVIART